MDEPIDEEQQAYENFQKLKEERQKEANAQEIRDRIEKSKNRRKQYEKLQGKSLADMEGEDDGSALAWIQRSRQQEKERASQIAKAQAKSTSTKQYKSSDLEGLKVAHDLDAFDEGQETILTLKDRGILDDDDADELTNVNMEDHERLMENLENKKKKPGYNPYADDEQSLATGQRPDILSQYDERTKGEGFVLGKQGLVAPSVAETRFKHQAAHGHLSVADKLKQAQTLDYNKQQDIKDYYTQDELTFKKPKKLKKKKKLRQKTTADADDALQPPADDPTPAAAVPSAASRAPAPRRKKMVLDDANFVDDDDLQAALAVSRREANRQKSKAMKRMTPEEIARAIADERQTDEGPEAEEDNGLVFSETTEFLSNVGKTPAYIRERQTAEATPDEPPASSEPASSRLEHVEEDHQELDQAPATSTTPPMPPVEDTSMEAVIDEPLVGRGLAATLSLLGQKGLIKKATKEQEDRDRLVSQQLKWQNEARHQEVAMARRIEAKKEDRPRDRESRRHYDPELEKERDERDRLREFEERMANYKPDVKLEYVDEQGNELSTKDAFRFMSHKFHGKTSGKGKTEKRLKKLDEQRKLNNMASSDTPLNLAGALLERQQQTGSAHVVLSVGNRGVISSESGLGIKRSSDGTASERPNKKR
ncbi:SART-1 protein [Hesseltinella vesiculosa]|uniref:SART-1 protein n=1 Tax=Hesseltinella vesiculosa TaxID=101127 RepID=A0A1X2GAI0_9FUNG|nr:SART-1 protein [Hesseltinella vesiculosa]